MAYRYRRKRHRRSNINNDISLLLIVLILLGGGSATLFSYQSDFDYESWVSIAVPIILVVILLVLGYALLVRYIQKRRREEEYLTQKTIWEFLQMDPFDFEKFIGWVFEKLDYKVEVTRERGDHGLDATMSKDGKRYAVQVKRYGEKHLVSEPELRDFYGSFRDHAEKGFFVTTSDFTLPAKVWAKDKPIELIAGEDLVQIVHDFGAASPRELFFKRAIR